MKFKFRKSTIACFAFVAMSANGFSQAQGQWTKIATTGPQGASLPLLLTDGRVLVHDLSTPDWWTLTPNNGDYVKGTWKKVASMSSNYAPLYFSSAVLKDGRVWITGGEYNFGQEAWTNQGAWYDPVKDKWTAMNPPSGWTNIGDVQNCVMPDGHVIMASLYTAMAILDPLTMTWSPQSSTGKADGLNEEGWTLMPDGTILTADATAEPGSERYIPSLGKWISAGTVPVNLEDSGSEEMGPQVLLPSGKVVVLGAIGHNAIYTPGNSLLDTGSWAALPDLPSFGGGQLGLADAPACLLPSGNVLFGGSPGVFAGGTFFYEFNGTGFDMCVNQALDNGSMSCYMGNMLMLPTGQVLFTKFDSLVQVYTPTGSPQAAWRPTITSVSNTLTLGKSSIVKGTQFNGLSQCSAYGDDNTNATNYPLARITYKNTGHVVYFRTHDHSTMAVATGKTPVTTTIDVPLLAETGPATLEIVANGIASTPANVTIVKDALKPDSVGMYEGQSSKGSLTNVLTSDNTYFSVNSIQQGGAGQIASAFATFSVTGNNSSLTFGVETNVSQPCQILYFLYNWNTGLYENVGQASQTTTDKETDVTATGIAKYVSSQGKVKILIRAVQPNRSNRLAPITTLNIDLINLTTG